jgi:uncharacterized protein YlxP (DUF503 family)
MVIGVCTLELSLPATASLKDKRQVIKSLIARLRNEFNISVAEVGAQDQWQWAVIGVSCVSSDRDYAQGLLSRVVSWVQDNRLDCDLADYQVQIM